MVEPFFIKEGYIYFREAKLAKTLYYRDEANARVVGVWEYQSRSYGSWESVTMALSFTFAIERYRRKVDNAVVQFLRASGLLPVFDEERVRVLRF